MVLDVTQLIEHKDVFIKDLLRQLLFALNWPDVSSTDAQLEQLIQAGYFYNMWDENTFV